MLISTAEARFSDWHAEAGVRLRPAPGRCGAQGAGYRELRLACSPELLAATTPPAFVLQHELSRGGGRHGRITHSLLSQTSEELHGRGLAERAGREELGLKGRAVGSGAGTWPQRQIP